SHADHHVGRIVDFIDAIGELENTLVLVLSDNGASAEGGPHGTVNEALLFNGMPESLDDNLSMLGELGGPRARPPHPPPATTPATVGRARGARRSAAGRPTCTAVV